MPLVIVIRRDMAGPGMPVDVSGTHDTIELMTNSTAHAAPSAQICGTQGAAPGRKASTASCVTQLRFAVGACYLATLSIICVSLLQALDELTLPLSI